MNTVLRILRNALCDPRQTPNLLLLQLRVAVEHAKLELLQERQLVQVHLRREEPALQTRRSTPVVPVFTCSCTLRKEGSVLGYSIAHRADLVNFIRPSQNVVASGE